MIDKDKVKVQQDSVKAADPGIAFTLVTSDSSPFDCSLTINVNIISPITGGSYSSSLNINQKIFENNVECLIPFGDGKWTAEKGKTIEGHIGIYMYETGPDNHRVSGTPPVQLEPFKFDNLTAEDGVFKITVVPNKS